MESKSVDSILFYILGSTGFILFFLGAAMLDTYFEVGTLTVIVGLAFFLWSAYEGGYFRANKK